jgi:hypothetical protein
MPHEAVDSGEAAMRLFHRVAVILCAASLLAGPAVAASSPSEAPSVERLSWLAGTWSGESGGMRMEEHWMEPRGGMMLGLHRDLLPGGKLFFEYLRIETTEQGIAYVASPRGGRSTRFPLLEMTERRVVFENPDHDFPQRIAYELREAGRLCARIEGEQDGKSKASEWCWEREPR